MCESYLSVVSEDSITCGTHFGPLPLATGSPDSLAVLTWRCVDKLPVSKQALKVNVKDQSKVTNWLPHILPARNSDEQNLEIIVKSGQLFFRSLRDIGGGEELRAWFGQDLADILKLPMIPPNLVEGEKRFECMLCQEQFENPFPVVAHLMYRCRRKDQGIAMQSPLKKRNGGRVKNFNIATLTDMTDSDSKSHEDHETPNSPSDPELKHNVDVESYEIEVVTKKRKRLEEINNQVPPSSKKTMMSDTVKRKDSCTGSDVDDTAKTSNGAIKLTSPGGRLLYSTVDLAHVDGNTMSAFKKVDKSSASYHPNATALSNFFTGALDPRELLFQAAPNNFASFPYALNSMSGNPPYPRVHLSQNGLASMNHPSLSGGPVEGTMSSAFSPNTKLTTTSSASHQHMKMEEEYKIMRKMPNLPENGYDIGALLPPRPAMSLHYPPKPQSMDVFAGNKTMSAPLLPFLPPSLAALTFPSQNWCAKCNASFRMTSDLVYHMRSHHKRETDPQKLKREEKLRCHICNETFRERHHLTRHMTSHQ